MKFKMMDAELDGDIDIITIHAENGNKLWINNGSGSFGSLETIFGNNMALSIGCADIDGDSDIDVIFG